ncbi:hypothetical protein BJV82DRAFT_698826 [Fennellomyces sp. T-0311]|nr:hypothetical protein BJV82DRAFT_698826 [Fennellomyces sp. T-0311]
MHRMGPDIFADNLLCYPVEETVNDLVELVKEGKIQYIGLSEMTPDELRRAHKVHFVIAVQVEYSPWTLDIETNTCLQPHANSVYPLFSILL